MRLMFLLLCMVLLAAGVSAEESAKAIVYPDDLPENLLMKLPASSNHTPVQQEFVEVTAAAYPGLKLELPSLKKMIALQKRPIAFPTHDPRYYQAGGMILAYWGFPMVSSEIISTKVP